MSPSDLADIFRQQGVLLAQIFLSPRALTPVSARRLRVCRSRKEFTPRRPGTISLSDGCIASCHCVTIPQGVFVKSRQKQQQPPPPRVQLRGTRACCARVRVSKTQAGSHVGSTRPWELRSEAETGVTPPLVSASRARGQTTATAVSEVEEQEKNNAPRRQKAPPPEMRPASLAEPQDAGGVAAARRGAGALLQWCRFLTLLCRRWWTSWTC